MREVLTALMGFQGIAFQPGGCWVQGSGTPGIPYKLQSSPDLANWLDLATLPAGTNGVFQFLDTAATNDAKRFYRLKYP